MASVIEIKLDGDNDPWPDLEQKQKAGKLSWQGNGAKIKICCLSRGTKSGRPSAALRIDMRDGTAVVAECTIANLISTLRILEARFAQEVDNPGQAPHQN